MSHILSPIAETYPLSESCLKRREQLRAIDPNKWEALREPLHVIFPQDDPEVFVTVEHESSGLSVHFLRSNPDGGKEPEAAYFSPNTAHNVRDSSAWELWSEDLPLAGYWGGLGVGTRLYIDGAAYLRARLGRPARLVTGTAKGGTPTLRKRLHAADPYTFQPYTCPLCSALVNESLPWSVRTQESFSDHPSNI